MLKILEFSLEGRRYALPLEAVDRVVRAVEVTPLPKAPEVVLGVVNERGRVIPVMDIRRRFGLPDRGLELEDRIILARSSRRRMALLVESVAGIHELSDAQSVGVEEAIPFAGHLRGVAKLPDGLVLIQDLDLFLSLDEEKSLADALPEGAG